MSRPTRCIASACKTTTTPEEVVKDPAEILVANSGVCYAVQWEWSRTEVEEDIRNCAGLVRCVGVRRKSISRRDDAADEMQ